MGYTIDQFFIFIKKPRSLLTQRPCSTLAVFLLEGILVDIRKLDSGTTQFESKQRSTVCGFAEAAQFSICYDS